MVTLDKHELSIPADMRGLLDKPDVISPCCAVCFRPYDNEHHVVFKASGGVSKELEKRIPRIRLCGMGNASGCHGKAHHRELHFDFRDGGWMYLETGKPTKRNEALEMPGWKLLGGWELVRRDAEQG